MSVTCGDFTSISTTNDNVCFQLAIRVANPPGSSRPARVLDLLVMVEVGSFKISFRTTGEVTDMPLVGAFPRPPAIMGTLPFTVVPRHLVAWQWTSEDEYLPAAGLRTSERAPLTRPLCGSHLRREKTRVRPPSGGGKTKHLPWSTHTTCQLPFKA